MADNQQNLKILVTTEAQTGGAKEAATEVEKTTAAAKKASEATEEHKEKVHFLGLETGELRKLTRELGEQFPIAAEAARLFLNPMVFGITTAIAVFGKLNEALADWNKELDEAGQRAAEHDFLPGIEAKAASLAHARQEMANYRYELAHTTSEQQKFMTALSDTNVLLNAQFEADKKVRDAKLNAQVDAINRNPNLSEDQKRIAVEAAQRNAGVRDEQAERDRENAEIADKQKAAFALRDKQKELDAAHDKEQAKADTEKADIDKRAADIDKQKDALPDLKKKMDEAQAAFDAPHPILDAFTYDPAVKEAVKAKKEEELKKASDAYQKSKDAIETFKEDNNKVSNQQNIAKTTGDDALKNKTDYEQLIHDLGLLVQKANIRDAGADQSARATSGSGDAAAQITLASKAEHARETGRAASQAQSHALDEIIQIGLQQHANIAALRRDLNNLASAVLNEKGKEATTKRILGMLGGGS